MIAHYAPPKWGRISAAPDATQWGRQPPCSYGYRGLPRRGRGCPKTRRVTFRASREKQCGRKKPELDGYGLTTTIRATVREVRKLIHIGSKSDVFEKISYNSGAGDTL